MEIISGTLGGITQLSKRNKRKEFNPFNISLVRNNDTYIFFLEQLQDIYMTLYSVLNLEESMDERFIAETMMHRNGIAVFYEEEIKNLIHLPFNEIGMPNIYNNPRKIQVFSSTGYYRILNSNEFVIIWSNYNRTPPIIKIRNFADRLYEVQRTIDVHLALHKISRIIKASENNKLSWQNLMMQVEGNIPTVYTKPEMELEDIITLDLSIPYIIDKLENQKHEIVNEFLTWCGIENSNRDKKERMVSDEVNSNYGHVEMSRNTGLRSRQEGWNRVNKKFHTNIEVIFNSEVPTLLNNAFISKRDIT